MKVSALIAVLLLVCGSVCQAQPVVRMVTINVNVKNSTTSAADFRGRILAPDGSTVLSATGLPESFAISLPSDNAVSDYNYVLTLSFGERYEQYFVYVREVHLGKSYSWDFDGTNIDVTQRS